MIYRKILCPIDFEQDPQPALTLAGKLARESRGTICLVHVLPVATVMRYPSQAILQADWDWAHKKLQKLAAQLPAGTDHEIIIKFGRTVEELAKVARTVDADLIVMGTHGYTGLARLIHGSVAEKGRAHGAMPGADAAAGDLGRVYDLPGRIADVAQARLGLLL